MSKKNKRLRATEIFKGPVDAPECPCGPDPMQDGLWPCDQNGNIVHPDKTQDLDHIVCRHCGRIGHLPSRKVIGKRNVDDINDEIDRVHDM